MNSTKIRAAVTGRGITSLYHFTPLMNLESILVNGLVSRQVLDQHQAPYVYTDGWRNDGQPDAVSLSIHDINRAMFTAKLRQSQCQWVILEIEPSILWTHPCRFCWANAASSEIVKHTGFIGGPWAFEEMFVDRPVSVIDRRSVRAVLERPTNMPTRNDAEVQVLAPIAPEFLRDITVAGEADRLAALEIMASAARVLPIAVVPEIFAM